MHRVAKKGGCKQVQALSAAAIKLVGHYPDGARTCAGKAPTAPTRQDWQQFPGHLRERTFERLEAACCELESICRRSRTKAISSSLRDFK
eukprot:3096042-Pyramimonas_sp.AAC.1